MWRTVLSLIHWYGALIISQVIMVVHPVPVRGIQSNCWSELREKEIVVGGTSEVQVRCIADNKMADRGTPRMTEAGGYEQHHEHGILVRISAPLLGWQPADISAELQPIVTPSAYMTKPFRSANVFSS
jgi:hypothetical protein